MLYSDRILGRPRGANKLPQTRMRPTEMGTRTALPSGGAELGAERGLQ